MNGSQKRYAEKKQPDTAKNMSVWFHLYKIPEKTDLIYSDRKQISGCPKLEGLSEKQYKGIFWGEACDLYLDCTYWLLPGWTNLSEPIKMHILK